MAGWYTVLPKLQDKVKSRLGYLHCNGSSFTTAAKLTLMRMTILPMLDFGDVIYWSASKGALERLDVLYHSAIRFATNAPYRTHHCTLLSSVNWSSLYTCRKTHWLMLIYKTLLGLSPPYLRYLLQPSSSTYNIRSASHILLKVPKAHTSLGRPSFQFAADGSWNELQKTLKLHSFISLGYLFNQRLNNGHSYWQLWLLHVMYCCLYLLAFLLLSVPNNA